jgi:hypothetical protein
VQILHEQLQSLDWPSRYDADQADFHLPHPIWLDSGSRKDHPMLLRILMWPVISLVVTGLWHLTIEAIWPDLQGTFVPAVLAPLLLSYGVWVGYRAIMLGAGFVAAVGAGLILGLLPLGLDIVGFGIVLDRGVDHGLLAGVFGLSFVIFGALIGAGFAESGMLGKSARPR